MKETTTAAILLLKTSKIKFATRRLWLNKYIWA